ncbi:symk-1 [Pristionchus pacificus]|nr:symk-1 [Pristionchus pacificus]
MDDVEIQETLDEQIASSLEAAQNAPVKEKLRHLKKTEELLLDREGGAHLIDNFLDEMLEFAELPSPAIKIFVLSFIEKACKKDAEVMKKAIHTLYRLLMTENENKSVIKKAMLTCMNIYSILLRWAVQRKSDTEVESCWDKFSTLKGRIMFHIDSENEGIRTRAIKFLEMVVLAQSTGNDKPDEGPRRLMSLGEIPRDHRFISYRKMSSEAQHSMQSLIDQTSLPHISSQNLLTVLCAICNIVRQRPEFLPRVVDAIDVLQVNLPPTLGTSQVKAVRKELKMHLIRLMKLPSIVPHVNKISTLLSDLGASQAEIQKVMPAEAKRKPSAPLKEDEPAMKKRRDQPGTSSAVMDDDEEEEDEEGKKERVTMDSAIDVTQNYIYSRLNHKVVTNLVLISLATLPDVMPPAFQSTYTPIASAGSEEQRMRLARMIATQSNSKGIGPGAEMLKEQKLRAIQERAVARNEGALIPPTPIHFLKTEKGKVPPKRLPARVNVPLPPPTAVAPKSKVQTNIVSSCKEMTAEERDRLFMITLERLMDTERRAQQGGAAQAQHKILVRLVSRFQEKNHILEDKLIEFIIAQHKSRSELALLWVAEMYAQYQGFTLCFAKSHDDGRLTQPERLARYNKVLVLLLRRLFERELHKETVFHKILLEAPLLTPDALSYLKLACTDPVFHPFAIMTLRELVLSRSRQRSELLQLLFHLTFYEKIEIRTQSVETVKELFELPYMKNCVRSEVESQLEDCTKEYPPPHFIVEEGRNVWSAALFKAALTLPLATLIHDHSLIHLMAKVFAKSTNNDFKLAIMRQIDNSVKSMGQGSEELLKLLEECPQGAESFVARIVHLLTERAPGTPEIVHRLKKLHDSRQTDVRSLLPILPGLSKEDILILLPKFVIHPTMAKSFGQAAKRILSTKNSESGQYSITPTELIVEYHRINATTPEEKKLLKEHVRTVLTAHRSITKEIISSAIEELLRVNPVPQLLFHTIVVVYELHNHLHAFLSNVLHKLITRELWKENGEYEKDFFAAIVAMPDVSYQVALTKLCLDDLKRLMESTNEVDVGRLLKNALPTLSTHQQKEVSDEVLEVIGVSERPCEVRERERKRDQKEREDRREKEGSRIRDNRGDKTDRRRGDREEKKGERSSSRRSYAIGEHR